MPTPVSGSCRWPRKIRQEVHTSPGCLGGHVQATAPLRSAASAKGVLKLFTTKKSALTQLVGNCKAVSPRLSCNFWFIFQGVICA